jgi:hypothetical protein
MSRRQGAASAGQFDALDVGVDAFVLGRDTDRRGARPRHSDAPHAATAGGYADASSNSLRRPVLLGGSVPGFSSTASRPSRILELGVFGNSLCSGPHRLP